jgi:hypothetical protein
MRRTSPAAFLAFFLLPFSLFYSSVRADVIIHDFETDTEGWENEAPNPVLATRGTNMVHHGAGALSFTFDFKKGSPNLHVRCKEGYPKNYSMYTTFRGFTAWVYIARPTATTKIENFEVQMFVRSGESWQWTTGDLNTELGLGWVRVDIRSDQIFDVGNIQDIGIQVRNHINDLKVTVYIDQVEALGVGVIPPPETL